MIFEKAEFLARKGPVFSMENRFKPIRLHMKATTFQQILSQFLEEESPASRGESAKKAEFKPQFTSHEPEFIWFQAQVKAAKKSGYAPPPPREKVKIAVAAPAQVVPPPEEPSFLIDKLAPDIQLQIAILTRMGANFPMKISSSLLKKAHRRLAKQLHPDSQGQDLPADVRAKRGEDFLRLQSIYESLLKSLREQ